MSAPYPVRNAVGITALTLIVSFIAAVVHPAADDVLGLGTMGSAINAATIGVLLWKLTHGSSAARFALSVSIVLTVCFDIAGSSSDVVEMAVSWGCLIVQCWAVAMLYGDEAGRWFAKQRLSGSH